MFPGNSPVLADENGNPTNRRPAGNDRRWRFYQFQATDQPQVDDQYTEQGNAWLETWRIHA